MPTTVVQAPPWLTLGDVARHFDVELWQVRRLFQRGFLPAPARAGLYRIVPPADLAKIEAALRRAGYLSAREPAGCA